MSDYWCEETIRLLMMKAVRSAEIYKNDKTEPNKRAAFEHAHNAIILARNDPVLSAETPSFVEQIAAYFDDDAKMRFERIYERQESHIVPESLKLTIHNYSMKSEAEFWGPDRAVKDEEPKDSKPAIHNYSLKSEAEFWGPDRAAKDEGSTKASPPTG